MIEDASGRLSFPGRARFHSHVRSLAAALALVAVICLVVAIAGMVTGRPGDRAGMVIRVAGLACFVAAVAVNVAAH